MGCNECVLSPNNLNLSGPKIEDKGFKSTSMRDKFIENQEKKTDPQGAKGLGTHAFLATQQTVVAMRWCGSGSGYCCQSSQWDKDCSIPHVSGIHSIQRR